jgi:hypothetical protein
MNLVEGLRRIGVAIGVPVFAIAGLIALNDGAPSQSHRDWSTKAQLIDVIWDDQTTAYRSQSTEWEMERQLYPGATDAQIVGVVCASAGANARILAICKAHNPKGYELAYMWTTHVVKAIGVAILAALAWGVFWGALMWIVSGFASPKKPA